LPANVVAFGAEELRIFTTPVAWKIFRSWVGPIDRGSTDQADRSWEHRCARLTPTSQEPTRRRSVARKAISPSLVRTQKMALFVA